MFIRPSTEPIELWKPTDPEFIRNPYKFYEQIQSETSVFRDITGSYVVVGYKEVKEVLLNKCCKSNSSTGWISGIKRTAQKRGIDLTILEKLATSTPLENDPPKHTMIRSSLLEDWPDRETMLQKVKTVCNELSSNIPSKFDFVDTFAKRLPLYVISDLLGIDRRRTEPYIEECITLAMLMDTFVTIKEFQAINDAANRLYNFFDIIYSEVPANESGVLSVIKRNLESQSDIDPIAVIIFLFIASIETTSILLARCFYYLKNDRTMVSQLRSDGLIKNFVNEILRLNPSLQLVGRTNSEKLSIGSVDIPVNSYIILCLGAANRDRSHFDNPHEVILNRLKNDHLSFGQGIHYCIGSHLATIEAIELTKVLLPIVNRMNLDNSPVFGNKLSIRSILSMKVSIT